MELVAFLGSDKENWGQIAGLIKRAQWKKVILITNIHTEGVSEFPNAEIVSIDSKLPLLELKQVLIEQLKKKLSTIFEVSLSLASGNGKEHMALLGALVSIPVGVRVVAFTKKGVEYLT